MQESEKGTGEGGAHAIGHAEDMRALRDQGLEAVRICGQPCDADGKCRTSIFTSMYSAQESESDPSMATSEDACRCPKGLPTDPARAAGAVRRARHA